MGVAQRARRRERILRQAGHRCRQCGAAENLTLDHIIPRAWGGTDALDNIQVLCRPCNEKKGSTLPPGETTLIRVDNFPTTRIGDLLDAVL